MKKQVWAVVALVSAFSLPAQAGVSEAAGVWRGEGAVFESGTGAAVAQFRIEMTSVAVGEHGLKSVGKVIRADGQVDPFEQTLGDAPDGGFTMASSQGNGGGTCFGEGLCEAYLDQGNGAAAAVTIVHDGPGERRYLITLLQNGRAVRFVREKLTRSQ